MVLSDFKKLFLNTQRFYTIFGRQSLVARVLASKFGQRQYSDTLSQGWGQLLFSITNTITAPHNFTIRITITIIRIFLITHTIAIIIYNYNYKYYYNYIFQLQLPVCISTFYRMTG